MGKDVISLFQNNESTDVVSEIKNSIGLQTVDGVPCLLFVTNRGKGSGTQVVPLGQLSDVIQTLRGFASDGLPEASVDDDLPVSDVIRRTITMEDGIVSFRCRNGKGAKPARVPADQFAQMVAYLVELQPAIEAASKKLQ
jgi:hypothetical protein